MPRPRPRHSQRSLWAEYPGGDGAPGVFLNSGIVPNGSPLFSPGNSPLFGANGNPLFSSAGSPVFSPAGSPVFSPSGSPLLSPAGGRRALRAALARDRRTFGLTLSAAVAGVTAAVLFGSFAPLHSTWMASDGPGAAGGPPPQARVPWSAAPLGILSGAPVPQDSLPGPLQGRLRRPGEGPASPRPSRYKPGSRTSRDTAARARASVGQGAAAGRGAAAGQAAAAGMHSGTGKGASGSSSQPPGQARRAPEVVVRYLVDRQWPGGFQAQVQVINNGAQPIADWQAVVSLPGDTVTSVQNASRFVSNHILLLSPASAAQVVPPGGGTLNIFFVASGTETVPAACAFNQTTCG